MNFVSPMEIFLFFFNILRNTVLIFFLPFKMRKKAKKRKKSSAIKWKNFLFPKNRKIMRKPILNYAEVFAAAVLIPEKMPATNS